MCHRSMAAGTLHRQVSLLATGGRQGASRSGCVWLRLTLWVYSLDHLCFFWHSQVPDIVSVPIFQMVHLVADSLIPRQYPNKRSEQKLVGIAGRLQLPVSFFFLTIFLLKMQNPPGSDFNPVLMCVQYTCQFLPGFLEQLALGSGGLLRS